MDVIFAELMALAIFGAKFIMLYVPCFIGSISGIYFNKVTKANKTKKKTTTKQLLALAFSSSILPTLLIIIAEYIWPENMELNEAIKYAIVMVLGFVGADKVTEFLKSFHNLMRTLKAISGGMSGLIELSNEEEESSEKE